MSGYWPPSEPGLDPADYADGTVPVKNDATGKFEGGVGGPPLSDATPSGPGGGASGVSLEASRADHVHPDTTITDHAGLSGLDAAGAHPIGSITGLVVAQYEPGLPQDGWVWFDTHTRVAKVRVAGAWVKFGTDQGTPRLDESGAERLTEDGTTRLLEGV